jgi:ABC-type glycerol-3-phosphate transport system substrate-binding protein
MCILIGSVTIIACTPDGDNGGVNGGNGGGLGSSGDLSTAMGTGRFIETERTLPEALVVILDMVLLEDGTLRMIDQLGVVYDSEDNGATWSASSLQFDVFQGNEEAFLFAASLASNGSAFLSSSEGHFYVDSAGSVSPVEVDIEIPDWGMWIGGSEDSNLGDEDDGVDDSNVSGENDGAEDNNIDSEDDGDGSVAILGMDDMANVFMQMTFTSNHQILGRSVMGRFLYLIEPSTGEILQRFGQEDSWAQFMDFTEINGQLIVLTSEGIDIYDLESGRLLETPPALLEHFGGREGSFVMGFGMHTMRIFPTKEADSLFVVQRSGLYHFTLGGNHLEQIINGALTTMSNPAYSFGAVLELPDNNFLISYVGGDGQRLMSYSFDPDADVVPSEELTVFSLFDHPAIRQAVSVFQSDHPHLFIQYEVGIPDEDSAITISDAITSLNTRIMAGTGPDILILDGMPYEAYIENGILLELSQVVSQLTSQGNFFENILKSGSRNGEIHLLPTSFFLLAVTGPPELLGDAMNLSDLADVVEGLRRDNPDSNTILGWQAGEAIIHALLHYSYDRLIGEDGTIDESVLTDFLRDANRIYTANQSDVNPPWIEHGFTWGSGFGRALAEPRLGADLSLLIEEEQKLAIGAITNYFEFDLALVINEKFGWDYALRNEFVPTNTIGINAGSNRIDEGIEFLQFMFSLEFQSSANFLGMPVNVGGIESRFDEAGIALSSLAMMSEDGEFIELLVYNASVEALTRLKGEIEQLNVSSSMNMIVLDVILREGALFLEGEQSLEEAVNGILLSVNLFLAE